MIKASALPSKYEIGKTRFYERRNYLLKLGYQVEPNKQGRYSFYSSEQVQLFEEEIYIETDPLEDIKEQQIESLHVAAQYNAAQNLAAFNYLTLDYMKHRNFTVDGLAEQVHKSDKAVRESFASMMESPEATTKKLLNKIRQRRSK